MMHAIDKLPSFYRTQAQSVNGDRATYAVPFGVGVDLVEYGRIKAIDLVTFITSFLGRPV
jgi:hypothetical protein